MNIYAINNESSIREYHFYQIGLLWYVKTEAYNLRATNMQNLRISTIFFTLFFLIGCGPSEEEIRQTQEASVLSEWNASLARFKEYEEDEDRKSFTDKLEFYMTSDGRGITFRESNFESIGFLGFTIFDPGVPDYIRERIANTAPIDGNQKAQYDNVEINWSVDRVPSSYGPRFNEVTLYVNLRLID